MKVNKSSESLKESGEQGSRSHQVPKAVLTMLPASGGKGWRVLGAAVCQQGRERGINTVLQRATASESTQEEIPANSSRCKEVPDAFQRVLFSSHRDVVTAGCQDTVHYTHLLQIKFNILLPNLKNDIRHCVTQHLFLHFILNFPISFLPCLGLKKKKNQTCKISEEGTTYVNNIIITDKF